VREVRVIVEKINDGSEKLEGTVPGSVCIVRHKTPQQHENTRSNAPSHVHLASGNTLV
jgi:hypothetical protein